MSIKRNGFKNSNVNNFLQGLHNNPYKFLKSLGLYNRDTDFRKSVCQKTIPCDCRGKIRMKQVDPHEVSIGEGIWDFQFHACKLEKI